jgi:cellulose synthase/poly-beta-1,6-N-acetylglucosamine synthase-like glycosyltransferase
MSPLLVLYFVTVTLLSVFGAHRLLLVITYLRHRSVALPLPSLLEDRECPRVLLQLPIYNERLVVERLVSSAAALDWPRDRLTVQLLDDSDDDTSLLAEQAIQQARSQGLHIEHIRREVRTDYKAGALRHGLTLDDRCPQGASKFIAIFDADFLPPTDFLRRILPVFTDDEGLGMVQARWTHVNRSSNLLTKLQAILLDGHFVLEHGARFRGGHFFNFNGTAGVWRRAAIDEAGGWSGDTITEDLDLSYRAQLAGWRFAYLQALEVPAELPEDASAFKSQQHRWAKGSIQTALKLLPRILNSPLPLRTRAEAFFHLAANLAYPLMFVLLAVLPITLSLRSQDALFLNLALDLPVFLFATASLLLFYTVAEREGSPADWLKRLPLIPVVLGLGAALTLNNSRAVAEALAGHKSPFVRTPKTGGRMGVAGSYRLPSGIQPILETLWGLYYLGGALYAGLHHLWLPLPFLLLFAGAFLLLGLGSLIPTHLTDAPQKFIPASSRPRRGDDGAKVA